MELEITFEAEQDLDDIWFFSSEKWSAETADAYLDALFDVFDMISTYPEMGSLRTSVAPPVRLYPYRSHNILYRNTSTHVSILRIVHGHRDWSALLGH